MTVFEPAIGGARECQRRTAVHVHQRRRCTLTKVSNVMNAFPLECTAPLLLMPLPLIVRDPPVNVAHATGTTVERATGIYCRAAERRVKADAPKKVPPLITVFPS